MYEMKSDIKGDSSGSENKFLMQVPSGDLIKIFACHIA